MAGYDRSTLLDHVWASVPAVQLRAILPPVLKVNKKHPQQREKLFNQRERERRPHKSNSPGLCSAALINPGQTKRKEREKNPSRLDQSISREERERERERERKSFLFFYPSLLRLLLLYRSVHDDDGRRGRGGEKESQSISHFFFFFFFFFWFIFCLDGKSARAPPPPPFCADVVNISSSFLPVARFVFFCCSFY